MLEQIIKKTQTDGSLLGYLLWWSMNGNSITHDDLVDIANRCNLDPKYLPSELSRNSSFRRAWRTVEKKLTDGFLLRQIRDDKDVLVVGLVNESKDQQNLELNYSQSLTVTFDKRSETIQATDYQHKTYLDLVDQYYENLSHNTNDIRSIITNYTSEKGILLRERRGGVYFVPQSSEESLLAVKATIETVNSGNCVSLLPLYDSSMSQDTLSRSAKVSLEEEIRTITEELEAYYQEEKTRNSTLAKRLETFDSIRSRVDTFAGILSFQSQDLLDKLDLAKQTLQSHLSGDPSFVAPQKEEQKEEKRVFSLPASLEQESLPDLEEVTPSNVPLTPFDTDLGF